MEEALGHFGGIEDECRRGLLGTHLRGALREINAQIAELMSQALRIQAQGVRRYYKVSRAAVRTTDVLAHFLQDLTFLN
jgi:hypothetical protein